MRPRVVKRGVEDFANIEDGMFFLKHFAGILVDQYVICTRNL